MMSIAAETAAAIAGSSIPAATDPTAGGAAPAGGQTASATSTDLVAQMPKQTPIIEAQQNMFDAFNARMLGQATVEQAVLARASGLDPNNPVYQLPSINRTINIYPAPTPAPAAPVPAAPAAPVMPPAPVSTPTPVAPVPIAVPVPVTPVAPVAPADPTPSVTTPAGMSTLQKLLLALGLMTGGGALVAGGTYLNGAPAAATPPTTTVPPATVPPVTVPPATIPPVAGTPGTNYDASIDVTIEPPPAAPGQTPSPTP